MIVSGRTNCVEFLERNVFTGESVNPCDYAFAYQRKKQEIMDWCSLFLLVFVTIFPDRGKWSIMLIINAIL